MKLPTALLFVSLVAAVVACGSVRSVEGLSCPCDTGYTCCGDVCVAGSTCTVDLFPSDGSCDGGGTCIGTSGFSGGGTAPHCTTLAVCCAKLPSEDAAACASEVEADDDANCATTIASAGTLCDDEPDGSTSVILPDAGTAPPSDAGKTPPVDAGDSENAYCYYGSIDAGDDCSYENDSPSSKSFPCGCTGTQGDRSGAAQTELNCMAGGGSIVASCPTAGLVGCCTSSYGGFAGVGYPNGSVVACSYGADSEDQLHCEAYGGTWSATPPT